MDKVATYSKFQLYSLVALRWAIGWHFLYEGVSKILNPSWSSFGFLMDSKGFLSDFFHWIASNATVLATADFLNVWGLTLVGIGLLLGCLTQIACIGGIVLLSFYCLSHPAFIGVQYAIPSEGSYLWINKNTVELIAILVLLAFPTSKKIGLDQLIFKKRK